MPDKPKRATRELQRWRPPGSGCPADAGSGDQDRGLIAMQPTRAGAWPNTGCSARATCIVPRWPASRAERMPRLLSGARSLRRLASGPRCLVADVRSDFLSRVAGRKSLTLRYYGANGTSINER
jgi:hypothetical protein